MKIAPDQAERDKAVDTSRSVIVQAPAGSGKTTLLVERYLRLLGQANRPEEILAITFTRKAAAEMRTRVLGALREGTPAAQAALARDDAAGWRLMDQPNRLKIQTIDSFASALVHQLPLTAGFRPGSRLLEDADDQYREAVDRLYQRLHQDDPLNPELIAVLSLFGNDYAITRTMLAVMLARRDQWLDLVRAVVELGRHDAEAVASLVSTGVEHLTARIIEELTTCLESRDRHVLEDSIMRAAENLDILLAGPADLYRLAGRVLVTGRGTIRRRLTRKQGFPARRSVDKAEILELLERLEERGAAPLLHNLRLLPADTVEGVNAEQLTSLCITLLLAVTELETLLLEEGVADFTQLVLAAIRALSDGDAPTELALALDYRIRHLLVDEFQDTSESQLRLFSLLLQGWSFGDGNTFFAVGDPMQSIYRFRQADVRVFFDAWHHGIAGLPLETVKLTANFRAEAPLVAWCNATFADMLGSSDDPLLGRVAYSRAIAARETRERPPGELAGVHTTVLSRDRDQADAIAGRVQALVSADPGTTIAVLVRSRSHLSGLLPALREAGIRWHATDVDALASRPVVRDLVALARTLANPADRLAWFSVLRSPWVGLDHPDLEAFAGIDDFAHALETGELTGKLSRAGALRLARFLHAWRSGRRLSHETPPRTALETAWLLAGGADAYAGETHLEDAERLFALMDDLGPDAGDPERIQRAAEGLFAEHTSAARVQIMTIHKAKGLEFDHVVLPFLDRATRQNDPPVLLWRREGAGLLMAGRRAHDLYEWLVREDRARDANERQRLLYVACTRARQGLHLFAEMDERPAADSFLGLLWPHLGDELRCASDGDPGRRASLELEVTDAVSLYERSLETRPQRLRLPADYVWQPPDRVFPPGPVTTAAAEPVDLAHLPEVALGTLMHQVLRYLSRHPLPQDAASYCRRHRHLWQESLADWGVHASAHERVLDALAAQLETVLKDPSGRWILEARAGADSELALTRAAETGIEHVFVDRTFVHGGERWIIDYKTGSPPAGTSPADFVAAESARHAPQLERYAAFARGLFPEPLVLALYFTAMGQLEVLPPEPR